MLLEYCTQVSVLSKKKTVVKKREQDISNWALWNKGPASSPTQILKKVGRACCSCVTSLNVDFNVFFGMSRSNIVGGCIIYCRCKAASPTWMCGCAFVVRVLDTKLVYHPTM